MSKKTIPQPDRNTTPQNGAPPRISPRNSADSSNRERNNSQDEIQLGQDPNATAALSSQFNALTQNPLMPQSTGISTNRIVCSNSSEIRRLCLERQRSLDSLLTEALRISQEALTEMRRGSDPHTETLQTRYSRQSSHNTSSDNDDAESNGSESPPWDSK